VAVVQTYRAPAGVDLQRATAPQLDAQARIVVGAVAQVRAGLSHLAHQQVGDGHARVRHLGFIADDDDLVTGGVLADRLGRDHAGRTGAQDHMLHGGLKAQAGAGLGLQTALGVPTAHGVVLGQHLRQLVHQALGRAGLGRLR
jgi:hypothetical protein